MTQLVVDLIGAKLVDKIGYRISALAAHIFSAIGLILLATLPDLLENAFVGFAIAVFVYAIGGGLIEVIISPIAQATPVKNKQKVMGFLHSAYSWGQVFVVLASTIFFLVFGIENWQIMALIWALVPIINALYFLKVPIYQLEKGEDGYLRVRDLLKSKIFWILIVLMVASGASEQAMSQWASAFAESGLKVSKALGDLAGPMLFAVLMGLGRVFFATKGSKWDINKFMTGSGILCIVGYGLAWLSPTPFIGFIGCALTGLGVAIMWPGTFVIAGEQIKYGGTAMFALLAFAGDLGCSAGPYTAGVMASKFQDNLQIGILAAMVFPILFVIFMIVDKKNSQKLKDRNGRIEERVKTN